MTMSLRNWRLLPGLALTAAAGLAPMASAQCPPGATGSCLVARPTPGCSDPVCCATVCGVAPECCTVAWDTTCVETADLVCGLCGASNAGSCYQTHATPSCDDAACCALVCSADPYCCQVNWDPTCVLAASSLCDGGGTGTCGDPAAGSCSQPHPTPACSDEACCTAVCAIDPTCCTQSWDSFCVTVAAVACATNCTPTCPAGSQQEGESCGISSNTACESGQAGAGIVPILSGRPVCGRIGPLAAGIDTDAFRIDVADGDGDGLARLSLTLTASGSSFVAALPAPCTPLAGATFHATVTGCVSGSAALCVPPGTWYLVVARGTFPAPTAPSDDCSVPGFRYTLVATATDDCDDACGGNQPCLVAHGTPGCADVKCCAAVCAEDPLCCNKAWDQLCVDQAFEACDDPAPPANDDCASAESVNGRPSVPFTTLGAAPTPVNPPPGCLTAGSGALGADVWFSLSGVRGQIELTTCAATGFDTAVVVYRNDCAGAAVACADDDPVCPTGALASTVTFTAQCGETYLIRVAGVGVTSGIGTLTVRQAGSSCPQCTADLNGDGTVDGTDLAAVLAGWGLAAADLNGDGTTDGLDLAVLLAGWGPCTP